MTVTPRRGTPIRVLVVDDSRFMRGLISRILTSDPQIEIVGHAADGLQAVEAVGALRPHVVTMDVQMPRVDGLAAVERIMADRPTPILMISSCTRQGSAAAIRALALGAVDFVAKPSGSIDPGLEELRDQMIQKVKMAARVRPVRTAAVRAEAPLATPAVGAAPRRPTASNHLNGWAPCVVIAASTGGPTALLNLIPALPRDLPASILIVQHMPAPYTTQLAKELDARSAMRVKEAMDGEHLERGTAYVSPGSVNLMVSSRGRVELGPAQRNASGCPSANVVMSSVAQHGGALSMGVVLTGMGRDGASGAEAIRRAGGIVIAQDEASSLIYGMPRAAVETGCVDEVVPLGEVARRVVQRLGSLGARRAGAGHVA